MYGCIQTVLSDPHEGNVRREGKLCRRSASRKMNLLTAHCVVSSVRVQRRVRFPSSVSVSIMKARASSAARSLRLHALRRRSSAKIEFPESRCFASALFFCKSPGGTLSPWIRFRFRRNRKRYPPRPCTAGAARDTCPEAEVRKSGTRPDFLGDFNAACCGRPVLPVPALPECGRRR